MKKIISLIKACMTDNMSIFKLNKKNKSKSSNRGTLIFVVAIFFFSIWSYANMIMESLIEIHMEYVLLTLFVLITTILTLIEGIYKSSALLFNCKDDDMLLSLPIKRSTVLFVRVFKFYVFELLYNSLFLTPAIIVYATKVNVGWTYYITSIIAILLLPIIPIVISCIIGGIISHISSKFKFKNFVQIVVTMIFLVFIFYISFNLEAVIEKLSDNASSINDVITKIYYPAGAYIKLVLNFELLDLLVFLLMHLAVFMTAIIVFSNIYFKINSKTKVIKKGTGKNSYRINKNKPIVALMKKEFNRFMTTPVFVINAGFGLILFLIGCIMIAIKLNGVADALIENEIPLTIEQISSYSPLILLGLIFFASLMSSITSSMISLEGKSFSILKSLPLNPFTIIFAKVLTAITIMIPFILLGDLVFIIRFGLNIYQIVMILIASAILPLISEIFGIIVNLKNPKMDAENDTEVVKQSSSTMIATLVGMLSTGINIGILVALSSTGITIELSMLIAIAIYSAILIGLLTYLKTESVKDFNKITV